MAITAKQVKELREMTGAGMMDCKKALTATEGDFDKAIEFLREKGLATAEKKAGRVAAEGLVKVIVSDDKKKAVAVEVNAETDFVAKNEKFQAYVAQVAEQAMETEAADIDAFLAETWKFDETKTVNEALAGQIAIIGENMNIRRFQQVKEDAGFVASYTHMGGKIGALVVLADTSSEVAKDVAMHVAAMAPVCATRSDVPADMVDHESKVIKEQVMNEGKPADIAEKMVTGRLNKFYKEICLEEQEFIKDSSVNVGTFVKNNGGSIVSMIRYAVGEGIEKKEENLC